MLENSESVAVAFDNAADAAGDPETPSDPELAHPATKTRRQSRFIVDFGDSHCLEFLSSSNPAEGFNFVSFYGVFSW